MSHNIVHTSNPIILNLGGNYRVEVFNVVTCLVKDETHNRSIYSYAYIIDGGGSMDMMSLNIASDATIDNIRVIASEVIKRAQGLNRLLDAINNEDN